MQLDQVAGDRKAESKAALPLDRLSFTLSEPIEQVRKKLGSDAASGVGDPLSELLGIV